jgi:hypothetical protein
VTPATNPKIRELESVEIWLDGPLPERGIEIARLTSGGGVPSCIHRFRTTLPSTGEIQAMAILSGLTCSRGPTRLRLMHQHRLLLHDGLIAPIVTFDKRMTLNRGDVLSILVEPSLTTKHLKVTLQGILLHPRTAQPWPDDFEPKIVYFEWQR